MPIQVAKTVGRRGIPLPPQLEFLAKGRNLFTALTRVFGKRAVFFLPPNSYFRQMRGNFLTAQFLFSPNEAEFSYRPILIFFK